jgi:hypothetical protein
MAKTQPSFRDQLADDPRLVRLYDYWVSLKGRRKMPLGAEFARERVKDLLPSIAIVEPRHGRFFVVEVGAEMAARIGSDATGLFLDQHASGRFLEFMLQVYRTVCTQERPVLSQVTYGVGRWNELKLRRLSLPFADAEGKVARIVSLVLFSWRAGAEPLVIDQLGDGDADSQIQAVDTG